MIKQNLKNVVGRVRKNFHENTEEYFTAVLAGATMLVGVYLGTKVYKDGLRAGAKITFDAAYGRGLHDGLFASIDKIFLEAREFALEHGQDLMYKSTTTGKEYVVQIVEKAV